MEHIVPLEDTCEHELSPSCWCHPLQTDDNLAIHHAADCREKFERQGIATSAGWAVTVIEGN